MMEYLYWITALAALLGVWLNIHGQRVCFMIWAATNATWAVVDYFHGIHAQAALQAIYFVLSIYGIVKWSDQKDEADHDEDEDPQ